MEARVERLEADIAEIKTVLGRLEPLLRDMDRRQSIMEGQLKHMPTLMQIGATMLAINAGIVAVGSMLATHLK